MEGVNRGAVLDPFQILVFSSTRARPWAAVSKYSGGLEGRRSNYTHGYPPPCGSANFFYDKPVALRGERCFVTAGRTRSAANPLGRPADTRSGSPRQCANSRRLPFQHLFFYPISILFFLKKRLLRFVFLEILLDSIHILSLVRCTFFLLLWLQERLFYALSM